jgi:hypothetical protein
MTITLIHDNPATLSVADDCAVAGCSDQARNTTMFQLTGTFTGVVTFEATLDGTTWVALNMLPSNSATPASAPTAVGVWTADTSGYKLVRARFSTATTGAVVVYSKNVGL